MEQINLLLIGDNPADVPLVWEGLAGPHRHKCGPVTIGLTYANSLDIGLQHLSDGDIDVVLLDPVFPDCHGLEALLSIIHGAPDVPIVVFTDVADETFMHQTLEAGAYEYVIKEQMRDQMLVRVLCDAVERQQMCRDLHASNKRFVELLLCSPDGVVVVDTGGIVRFANPAAEVLLGWDVDTAVGQPFGFSLVVGEIIELDIVGNCGNVTVTEMRVMETEWDCAMAYLVSFRDVTEHKRVLETLRQRDEQLYQVQKMEALGRLAGGVAHDFNNLLTAIIGYSDMMLIRLNEDDALYRYVERISYAADRAALITRQLLAFSRQQAIQPRAMSLNYLLAEMESLLEPLVGEDVKLTIRLAPHLGQVQADAGQMLQLVLNLVVNARDAMPIGGSLHLETANVDFSDASPKGYLDAPPGSYVMLMVRDTGEGMDAETLANLFEPFFTTKEVGKGTGLGLAVVYGILRQHGGDIEVHSEIGQGTTFKLYLPRCVMPVSDEGLSDRPSALPSGRETVLLVEDEEIVRMLTHDTLRINGYHVLTATDAREALQLCQQYDGPIHLLVTDVVMPEIGGRELADRLTQLRPDMRVMFMSGHSWDTINRRGVVDAEGAFLQKPFTLDTLARKVRQILDTAEGQRIPFEA